jgi:DNA-binding beta-propeller fold protein YncE
MSAHGERPSSRRRHWIWLPTLIAGLTAGAGDAIAAVGDYSYRDCFTAESAIAAGTNGCTLADVTAAGGTNTGLDDLEDVVASPNGSAVYGTARGDAALVRFDRAADGALAYRDCFTADSGVPLGTNECAHAATTGVAGSNTGLDDPRAIAASPDGESLYSIGAEDASILRLDSALALLGCLTADSAVPGANGCIAAPSVAGSDGADTGFEGLRDIVVSPEGSSAYAISSANEAILRFDRAADGALAYRDCFTADSGVAAGTNGCVHAASTANGAANTGFDGFSAAAISPDGASVYGVATNDAAILRFDRAADGALTYRDCFTADGAVPAGTNGCVRATTSSAVGSNTGFFGPTGVAVSPDNLSVYMVTTNDSSILRFDRAADGALTYRDCFTADSNIAAGVNGCVHAATTGAHGADTGLQALEDVSPSPDGKSVYATGQGDASLVRFDRAADGALGYRDCFTADSAVPAGANGCLHATTTGVGGANTGFYLPDALSASADGRSVYAVTAEPAILRFDREADAQPPDLALGGKRKQKSAKRVNVTASCDEHCTVELSGTVKAPKPRTTARAKKLKLKPASVVVGAGAKAAVALKLTQKARKAAKRRLRAGKKVKVTVKGSARDLIGNRASASRKIRLKPKRA